MSKELTRECRPGEAVHWQTIVGAKFVGILKEWDSNVAVVEMPDGKEKCVEC